MRNDFKVYIILLFSILYGCRNSNELSTSISTNKYAEYFQIRDGKCLVFDESKKLFEAINRKQIKSLAIQSTTQLAFCEALGEKDLIRFVSHEKFVCDSTIIDGIKDKSIDVIHFGEGLATETLLAKNADALFLESFAQLSHKKIKQLEGSGIFFLPFMDWKEHHPLARAEWIKVVGWALNKEALADSLFNEIESKYNVIRDLPDNTLRPTVFGGVSYRDNWFIPGGRSYIAQFIKDAGGYYVFESDSSTASFQLASEQVFQSIQKAHVWLASTNYNSIAELLQSDNRFLDIKCVQGKNVYANNKQVCLNGGNTYYSKGVLEPYKILEDLRVIFSGKEGELKYFNRLTE